MNIMEYMSTMYDSIMRLYSWNVNGIRAVLNKGALQSFLAEHDPDILCLQETKANRDQFEIDFPQYHEHFNSASRKGYSGTAIFSKTKPIQVIDNFSNEIAQKYELKDSYGDGNDEGRVTSAEFDNFWVVTVYTPNSKGDLSRLPYRYDAWDKAFLEHVLSLEKSKPVLFCGDLNVAHKEIDLARPKENIGKHGFTDEERERFEDYLSAKFVDSYRAVYPDTPSVYTWWTAWGGSRARNIGWRIDYWMASKDIAGQVTNPQIHTDVMGSDHCPVSIEVSV